MEFTKQLANQIHEDNKRWWRDVVTGEPLHRNIGEMLMLCVSELAEAHEGIIFGLMDDKLPHRAMVEVELADCAIRILDIIGGLNLPLVKAPPINPRRTNAFMGNGGHRCLMDSVLELSKALECHRKGLDGFDTHLGGCLDTLNDFADYWGYNLQGAMTEKLEYNRTRHDHTTAGRLAAGGKKY